MNSSLFLAMAEVHKIVAIRKMISFFMLYLILGFTS